MYACMYASMHRCIYACMIASMHLCIYVCMHACMHACMDAWMHGCSSMNMFVYMNGYVHVILLTNHCISQNQTWTHVNICTLSGFKSVSMRETARTIKAFQSVWILKLKLKIVNLNGPMRTRVYWLLIFKHSTYVQGRECSLPLRFIKWNLPAHRAD